VSCVTARLRSDPEKSAHGGDDSDVDTCAAGRVDTPPCVRSRRWCDTTRLPIVKRPPLPRLRTVLMSLVATVLAMVLVVGLGVVWTVRRPFPTYAGELTLTGLSAPVTVHR